MKNNGKRPNDRKKHKVKSRKRNQRIKVFGD